jgi:hypothetical protein
MSAEKAETSNDDKRLNVTVTTNPNDGIDGLKTKELNFTLNSQERRGV